MTDISFSKAFLKLLNEATIPSISGDDEYSVSDQMELIDENPDILLRMENPDKYIFKYIADNWKDISLEDQQKLLKSKYGKAILSAFVKRSKITQRGLEKAKEKEQKAKLCPSYYKNTIASLDKQLNLIKADPLNIIYIQNPAKGAILTFQNKYNGKTFNDPKKDKILNYYLKVDPELIDYTKPQPQKEALPKENQDVQTLEKVIPTSINMLNNDPWTILNMDNPSEEYQERAIDIDPNIIVYLVKDKGIQPSAKLISKALSEKPILYYWLSKHINIPTEALVEPVQHSPFIVGTMDTPNGILLNIALQKRPTLVDWPTLERYISPKMRKNAESMMKLYSQSQRRDLRQEDNIIISEYKNYNPVYSFDWNEYEDEDNRDDDTEEDTDDMNYSSLNNESVTDYLKRMKHIILSE